MNKSKKKYSSDGESSQGIGSLPLFSQAAKNSHTQIAILEDGAKESISNNEVATELSQTQSPQRFMSTGLLSLNKAMSGGFHLGHCAIIASRLNSGGNSLMIGAALQALYEGKRVSYFSERLSKDQVRRRFVVLSSRVNGFRFRAGLARPEDYQALAKARREIPWKQLSIISRKKILEQDIDTHAFSYQPQMMIVDIKPRVEVRHGDPRYAPLRRFIEHLSTIAKERQLAMLIPMRIDDGAGVPTVRHLPGATVAFRSADSLLLLYRKDLDPHSDYCSGASPYNGEVLVTRRLGQDINPRVVRLRFDQRFAGWVELSN